MLFSVVVRDCYIKLKLVAKNSYFLQELYFLADGSKIQYERVSRKNTNLLLRLFLVFPARLVCQALISRFRLGKTAPHQNVANPLLAKCIFLGVGHTEVYQAVSTLRSRCGQCPAAGKRCSTLHRFEPKAWAMNSLTYDIWFCCVFCCCCCCWISSCCCCRRRAVLSFSKRASISSSTLGV